MAGGEIVAVNYNGTERWRKKIANNWVDSSPCIAKDGTIYIGSSSDVEYEPGKWKPWGYLHAFGPVDTNNPPNTPTIDGPNNGKAGEEYGYYITSIDPDNNPVSFYIEWGDGSTTEWTKEVASDEKAMFKHTFSEKGNYTIQVKVKDTLNEESDWNYFEVVIPRKKAISSSWFLWFLERFPLLERLLNLIKLI
jgi:hypothetical protein